MPHSTTLIDSLPANPFDWRKPVQAKTKKTKTPEQEAERIKLKNQKYDKSEKGRARRREVYAAKRSYGVRFKTAEALENHRANSRLQDKKRRDKATLKRKAERVSPEGIQAYSRAVAA